MFLHALVHQRLRIAGLVRFVMAQPAKTNHIENHILFVFLPVVERETHRSISSLGIVAVDMKNRELRHSCDVSRINRRTPGFRRSSKSDLIVDDDMNCSAGAIAAKLRELESLHHDALTGERRVAM